MNQNALGTISLSRILPLHECWADVIVALLFPGPRAPPFLLGGPLSRSRSLPLRLRGRAVLRGGFLQGRPLIPSAVEGAGSWRDCSPHLPGCLEAAQPATANTTNLYY